MTEPGSVKWRAWLGSRHKWIRVFMAVTVLVVLAGVIGTYKARHVIYRQVLLAHIAYSIPDQSTDGDLAIALLNVTLESAPGMPKGVVGDNAAGTFIRGWSFCDGVAMAYVQLLERRGLEGQLLFLRWEDGGSPHSVATVKVDGKWRGMDVYYGTYSLTVDGSLATPEEIASGQAPVTWDPANPPTNLSIVEKEIWPELFMYSTPFYQTGFPGRARSLLRTVAGWGARVAPNLIQDLYLLTPPPVYGDSGGTEWEEWSDDGDKALWRARNYDLFDRTEKARAEYKKVIGSASDRKDEASYFLEDGRHWSGHPAMATTDAFGTRTRHFAYDGRPLPTGWCSPSSGRVLA